MSGQGQTRQEAFGPEKEESILIIREILFDDSINLNINYLQEMEIFLPVASFFVALASIISLNSEENPLSIVKRVLVGFLLIALVAPVQKHVVDFSFSSADKLYVAISSNSFFGQSSFFASYFQFKYEVLNEGKEGGIFSGVARFVSSFVDFRSGGIVGNIVGSSIGVGFLKIVQFLVLFSFIVLKVVYMTIYYLNIVLVVLPALVYIIPNFKNTFNVPIATTLWLFCHPFVVVVIVALMDAFLVHSIGEAKTITFDAALLIAGFSLILFSSIAMTGGIIWGSGMVSAVGTAASIAGPQMAINKGKYLATAAATKGASIAPQIMAASAVGAGRSMGGVGRGMAGIGRGLNKFGSGGENAGALSKAGTKLEGWGKKLGQRGENLEKKFDKGKKEQKETREKLPEGTNKSEFDFLCEQTRQVLSSGNSGNVNSNRGRIKESVESVDCPKALRAWADFHESSIQKSKDPAKVGPIRKKDAALARERADKLERQESKEGKGASFLMKQYNPYVNTVPQYNRAQRHNKLERSKT